MSYADLPEDSALDDYGEEVGDLVDPLDLLKRMSKALDERQKEVAKSEAWYEGDHPVPDPPPNTFAAHDQEARRAFNAMSRLAITNFLPPVVDIPASKLVITGFRFGESSIATDVDAWRIWQRNQLDADHVLTNTEALKVGSAPVLIWPDNNGLAKITVEDPSQVIVLYEPGERRDRQAALKRWIDDDGYMMANVFTEQGIYKYQSTRKVDTTLVVPAGMPDWIERQVKGEAWPVPNPWGIVPVVEVRANATLHAAEFGGGCPEFQKQLTDQRKINQTVMNMLITMEHQAFRQRWAIGWEPPTKPDGSLDKEALARAGAASLMIFDGEQVSVGEFSQADFQPFIQAIEAWVKVIASTSGTPPYAFLLGDMINVAADSLARIEGTQMAKVRNLRVQMGEPWEEILRIALIMEDNSKGQDMSSSVDWIQLEDRTATEQIAVAQGYMSVGAPTEAVFGALPDVDQQEVHRWMAMQAAQQQLAQATEEVTEPVDNALEEKTEPVPA